MSAGAFDPREIPWPSSAANGTSTWLAELPADESSPWAGMFEPLEDFLTRADAEPEPSWLIPELMPDRGKVFIVAEPSAGKTWMALLACQAAAANGRDVFLVEEEGPARSLGWRLKTLGVRGRLHIAHARAVLIDDDKCRAALVERVRQANRPVVVFDPFTSLHTGNENDTEHANNLRRQLTEIATAHPESLIIVCHHQSKNTERSDMYAGRGSSVFAGWVDVQLNLTHLPSRKEEGRVAFRVLLAKVRDGHRGLKRDVRIDLADGSVEVSDTNEEAADDIDGLIEKNLKGAPGGLQRSALKGLIRKNKQNVLARIDALLEQGVLEEARGDNGKKVVRLAARSADVQEEA